jgi:hypothetical protein
MAQYFVDAFTNADLSDFEKTTNPNNFSLTTGLFEGKECLIVTDTGSSTGAYSYIPAGTAADYEIACSIKLANTANNQRLGPAGNIASSANFYLGSGISDNVHITRFNAGSRSLLAIEYARTSNPTVNWTSYRFRKSGANFKVRYWITGTPEPTTWDIEITESENQLAAGKIGMGYFGLTVGSVEFLGIGTNGDAAPTAPLPTGPNTPTNPAVTNLQANSARLTWEQG